MKIKQAKYMVISPPTVGNFFIEKLIGKICFITWNRITNFIITTTDNVYKSINF